MYDNFFHFLKHLHMFYPFVPKRIYFQQKLYVCTYFYFITYVRVGRKRKKQILFSNMTK